MFSNLDQAADDNICEDCYRTHHYGHNSFVKVYKHCILAEAITPAASRRICHCSTVPHFDNSGRSRSLFPVEKEEEHLDVNGNGGIQCVVLKLGELVALAKYDGIQTVAGANKGKKLSEVARLSKQQNGDNKPKQERSMTKVSGWRRRQLRMVTGTSLHDAKHRTATSSATTAATDAQADEDIPLFF